MEADQAISDPMVTYDIGAQEPVELAYSPKLEDDSADEQELDTSVTEIPVPQAALTSQEDFLALLASLPASANEIKAAYIGLLALYNYTLGRLQLLEVVGSNGVLTDALITKLFTLNAENERLLHSETSSRKKIADLQHQLEEGEKQVNTSEKALQDAHQMLERQEAELDMQSKLISDLKTAAAARQPVQPKASTSNLINEQSSSSGRSRHYEHPSRRSTSDQTSSQSQNGHRNAYPDSSMGTEHARDERQASVTSSRQSSRREERRPDNDRYDNQGKEDKIDTGINRPPKSPLRSNGHTMHIDVDKSETRGISINGAAKNRTEKPVAPPPPITEAVEPVVETARLQEDEAEIDLGEDLVKTTDLAHTTVDPLSSSGASGPRAPAREERSRADGRSRAESRERHTISRERSSRGDTRDTDREKRSQSTRERERRGDGDRHRDRNHRDASDSRARDSDKDRNRERDKDKEAERERERSHAREHASERDRTRSRSTRQQDSSDRRHKGESDSHSRSSKSGHRSRSKSPVRSGEKLNERDARERRLSESEDFRSPPRVKQDTSSVSAPREESKSERKERSSSGQAGRSSNMYGRLGLPLSSGGGNRDAGLSIKGVGRSRQS